MTKQSRAELSFEERKKVEHLWRFRIEDEEDGGEMNKATLHWRMAVAVSSRNGKDGKEVEGVLACDSCIHWAIANHETKNLSSFLEKCAVAVVLLICRIKEHLNICDKVREGLVEKKGALQAKTSSLIRVSQKKDSSVEL